jgi:hypothetical protein
MSRGQHESLDGSGAPQGKIHIRREELTEHSPACQLCSEESRNRAPPLETSNIKLEKD